MKRLTTTALALSLAAAGTAYAESHTTGEEMEQSAENMAQSAETEMEQAGNEMQQAASYTSDELMGMQGDLIRSRDITGGNVYTTNAANDEGWDSSVLYDEVGAEWNQIGEIEDLILTEDGQIRGIVAEVGGFLDIADKHVVISVEDLSLVAVDDATYAYVTRFSEEDLEAREGVDEGWWN
jgi:hypothetical protein